MFPKESGLYLALKRDSAVLVRVSGFYPFLKLREGYDLAAYIHGGELKSIDQGTWYSICQDLDKDWSFSPILSNADVPQAKREFKRPTVELNEEEKEWFKNTYIECRRADCSASSIIQLARNKFNITTAQAKAFVDELSNYV